MNNLVPLLEWVSILKNARGSHVKIFDKLNAIESLISLNWNGQTFEIPSSSRRFILISDGSFLLMQPEYKGRNIVRFDAKNDEIWRIQAPPHNLTADYDIINFREGIWYVTANCHRYKLNIETGEVFDQEIDQFQYGIKDSPLNRVRATVTHQLDLKNVDQNLMSELKKASFGVGLNHRGYQFSRVLKQITFFEDGRIMGIYDFQDDNCNVMMVSPIPDATWRDPSDKISWTITPASAEDGYYDSVYEKDGEWFAQGPVNTYRLNIETGEATLLVSR